jgi:hypothetical protein
MKATRAPAGAKEYLDAPKNASPQLTIGQILFSNSHEILADERHTIGGCLVRRHQGGRHLLNGRAVRIVISQDQSDRIDAFEVICKV